MHRIYEYFTEMFIQIVCQAIIGKLNSFVAVWNFNLEFSVNSHAFDCVERQKERISSAGDLSPPQQN